MPETAENDPRVNPNGGATALGHPLGASGARLAATAVNQLHRVRGRYALYTMCLSLVCALLCRHCAASLKRPYRATWIRSRKPAASPLGELRG
jgi:hypothetical protein